MSDKGTDVRTDGTVDVLYREIWYDKSSPQADWFVSGNYPIGDPDEIADVSSLDSGSLGSTYDYICVRWTCLFRPLIAGTWTFKHTLKDDLGSLNIYKADEPGPSYPLPSVKLAFGDTNTAHTTALVANRWYLLIGRWFDLISVGRLQTQFMEPGGASYTTIASVANKCQIRKWNGYYDNAAAMAAIL